MKISTGTRKLALALLVLAIAPAGGAVAEDGASIFGVSSASVTYGPYARVEMGRSVLTLSDAYWLPPGPSDPRINFDVMPADDQTGFGAVAIGYDWQNGLRADVSVFGTGTTSFTAPCASTADTTPCATHMDITDASVRTTGVMANLFYAPLEARGSNAVFQPFVVAGLGVARNEVGDWTRTKNPSNPTVGSGTVRTFEGDTTSDVAWSVGLGASLQVTKPGQWPVIVELAWRYYDFGTAKGSATPIGSGSSPVQPLTFDRTDQVVTLGVRIPLRKL